ncbi:hypothetical protein E2C01_061302 [Portunus trituberculatus]|uniref:Uncharacterized protein n=1 Tax=Portunus trituberculatus TaxID=210409 RepID=A0A5B7HAY0_PORTR|nr:hypothetical protein [Portunus trituberculatus]
MKYWATRSEYNGACLRGIEESEEDEDDDDNDDDGDDDDDDDDDDDGDDDDGRIKQFAMVKTR